MTNKEYADRFLKDWDNGERIFTLTTSGSTGSPKNIALKREFLETSARATADHLHLDSRENILCCLPVNKMGGLMMLVRAKVLGCHIEICEPVSDTMLLLDEFHKFTFVSLVPLQLYEIFKNQESIDKLNRFNNVLIGGAEIDKQLELKVRQLNVTAWHTYGMTETYSHIALRKLNGSETTDYFTPMKEVIIKTDERGCLMIMAPVTNNEFIITNDLAEINNDGNFKITGRFDFVINSGGKKLQTEQLEKSIRELIVPLQNLQFILTSVKDEKFGEKLVLLVGSSPIKLLKNDWKEYTLKEGSYSIPKEIIFVEKIPFTETGKPDRIKAKEIVSLYH